MMEKLHYGPGYEWVSTFIDANPKYWIFFVAAAIVAIISLFYLALFTKGEKAGSGKNRAIFIGVCLATIFVFRALAFYHLEFNSDEGMLLEGALNFTQDGKIWVSVDTATLGPVNYIFLALVCGTLNLIGLEGFSFVSVRLANVLLISGSVLFFYRACALSLPETLARVVTLFPVIFFSFGYRHDLQAYNTEYPFIFLFSLCVYLMVITRSRPAYGVIWVAGLSCGLLPLVKLQTIPMMGVYIIWMLYTIWSTYPRKEEKPFSQAILSRFAAFGAAVALPTLLLIAYCATYENGLSNAYLFYIRNASAHVSTPLFSGVFISEAFTNLTNLFAERWFNTLFYLLILPLVLLLIRRGSKLGLDLLMAFFLVLATLFAILRPGTDFIHYLLFLCVPALVLLVETLRCVVDESEDKMIRGIGCLLAMIWIVMFHTAPINVWEIAKFIVPARLIEKNHFVELSHEIMRRTTPEDTIIVWGWEQEINVYTNRRGATAQGTIERIWGNRPDIWKPYPVENISIYINSIRKNKPRLIVDVVAPGSFLINDWEKQGLEKHPEVWPAVRDEYVLVYKYPVASGTGAYRIYERKPELGQ